MKNANKYILLAAIAGIIIGLVIKKFPYSLILKYIPTDQTEQMLFTFNKEASTVTANTGTANCY